MEEVDPIVQSLRSQLAEERQKLHQAEYRLASVQREHTSEMQKLRAVLDGETEKSRILQQGLYEGSDDPSKMNTKLKAQVDYLETQLALIKQETYEKFLAKDSDIIHLTEDNEALEGELKTYQEVALKSTHDLRNSVEALEKALALSREECAFALQKARHLEIRNTELTRENEEFSKDISLLKLGLKEAQKNARKANESKDEINASHLRLNEEIAQIEERYRVLEHQNDLLKKGLVNHEKTISSLESEMSEAVQDASDLRIKEINDLHKQVNTLNSEIKRLNSEISASIDMKENLEEKMAETKATLTRKVESLEKDKKAMTQQIDSLTTINTSLYEKITEMEINNSKYKEEVQTELQNRIMLLKQEKSELENTIQELSDQIDVNRLSSSDHNLQDELSQICDSRSSRNSTPRRLSTFDFKRSEKFVQELSDKNFQIVCLNSEKEALVKENAELSSAAAETTVLKAELSKLKLEFESCKRIWNDEKSTLMGQIEETEQVAIAAKLQYAEAATDRDVYHKMFLDLQKNHKRK